MIYFIRHGESQANQRGVFAGQKEDSVLTEKGREQARAIGQMMKSEGLRIDRIVSSPLERTRETAAIVAAELVFDADKISFDDRIIEYDMGSLTGTPLHQISSAALIAAKNAENINAFYRRVSDCIKELSASPGNTLVVSHAGVGRLLETIRENIEARLFFDLPPYPNASITKIDWVR